LNSAFIDFIGEHIFKTTDISVGEKYDCAMLVRDFLVFWAMFPSKEGQFLPKGKAIQSLKIVGRY
jgi:hypothetical protein